MKAYSEEPDSSPSVTGSSPESAITILALGFPDWEPFASIAFTKSIPSMTRPNTTARGEKEINKTSMSYDIPYNIHNHRYENLKTCEKRLRLWCGDIESGPQR